MLETTDGNHLDRAHKRIIIPLKWPFDLTKRNTFHFIYKRIWCCLKTFHSHQTSIVHKRLREFFWPIEFPCRLLNLLNHEALKTEGDLGDHESSIVAKPWKPCTVQQVEDFKNLLRIFPLWSSNIFLGTTIAIQSSLTILQALSMDRHLGLHFKFPAGSTLFLVQITVNISLTLIDRLLFSTWRNLTHCSPTLLQRIGLGHMLNILSMVVSALVESKRLKAVSTSTGCSRF